MRVFVRLAVAALVLSQASPAIAQWTNRHPRVAGYGHHVYLEGYELPLLTNGPIDPAVSPDGTEVAFASRGWLWILDLETRVARRVTSGPGIDARPTYSPDGTQLAFVRDHDNDTTIVLLHLASGAERVVVDTGSIDLDPAFTTEGGELLYSSAAGGDLDLWRVSLDGGEAQRVTTERGLELAPRPAPAGGLVYLAKTRGGGDQVRWRMADGAEQVIHAANIASVVRPVVNGRGVIALNVPVGDEVHLLAMDRPSTPMRLAPNAVLPITPAWSPDGAWVFYSEADSRQQMRLYRAPITGGPSAEVEVSVWDWGDAAGTVRIRTRVAGQIGFAPTRISAWTGDGHPLVAESGMTYLDGQSGWPFFYSDGDIEITVPAGTVRVVATQGISTAPLAATAEIPAGGSGLIEIDLVPVWAGESEWASGDHHFHLNYGGAYALPPQAMTLLASGEHLRVPTSLTANLHNRYADAELWGWENGDRYPLLRFGQEIRSHFLGHIALIGNEEMFWPWIWGPGYEVYGQDDRPNSDLLELGREAGAVGFYVHPVSNSDPFGQEQVRGVPTGIVADAVLGHLDALEVACLWSDERGTAELWYRFLNLGVPIAPTAGTDVMLNLVRTMAAGTTRVYVHQPQGADWRSYLDGLREGRSFVTNGPMIDFRVMGDDGPLRPGDVVAAGTVRFEIDLATASSFEKAELIVNGEVVGEFPGLAAAGSRQVTGSVELPAGGWVAVRATGGETDWPAMDSYPWAHTSPIWIGEVGSTAPESRAAAAADLLRALDQATERLSRGYGNAEIPRLRAHFAAARERLLELR